MSSVLQVPESHRVALQVKDLSIAVKGKPEKRWRFARNAKATDAATPATAPTFAGATSPSSSPFILSNVSLNVPAASLVAIMGGLGSGTTRQRSR